MILYLFITCYRCDQIKYQSELRISNIVKMMTQLKIQDFCFVTGGYDKDSYSEKEKIIKLNCNDYYEGLPEKMIKTLRFINNNDFFNRYTHICKLDDDMIIEKPLIIDTYLDYGGRINKIEGNRKWHIGKCSKNSKWNHTIYKGRYVPWAVGGYGYILSKKSISLILENDFNKEEEIYEDLMIAKMLYKKIEPINIDDLADYIFSPEHN